MVASRGRKGSSTPEKPLQGPYLDGLHDYWGDRPQTTIEHVSKILAEDPDHPQSPMLYRLWIETLADGGEMQALAALAEHLHRLSVSSPKQQVTFIALRGLIHLELDEWDAARLFASSLESNRKDPYCWELCHSVAWRQGSPDDTTLIQKTSQLKDYFHLVTAARALYVLRDQQLLTTLGRVQQIYPSSPLPGFYELHRCLDVGAYREAVVEASRLCDRWPGNSRFPVSKGLCDNEDG